ncbi:MAG: winged helix-turn-helix domain-containing protein [Pseudomonadota bacterium]
MIFQCSGLEFDTESFAVTREGEAVPVPPKVFDLLIFLMRHRDRLVTRQALFEALWAGRVVSDNVLSNEIKLARAVLGDDGEQQRFIKTVRGRGYQFVGEVREVEAAPEAAMGTVSTRGPAVRRALLGGSALLLVLVLGVLWLRDPVEPAPMVVRGASAPAELRPNTIAILPFMNRSDLKEDAYFVDGFHDDLITQIAKISGLTAISRSSVMAYRSSDKSLPEIGGELGSSLIIEGGVQRAAESVRINVQMIDAATDEHLWAETYTRELNAQNVFAIQSEIALAVAAKLRTVLSLEDQQNIARVPTENTAALEAFFRGRVSMALDTGEAFRVAVEHFREAVRLDPAFAKAHAQLGLTLLEHRTFSSQSLPQNLVLAEVAINKALSLDPTLSEAYEALALLERDRGNTTEARAAYERAIELNPGNAHAIRMYAFFQSAWLGEHESARALLVNAKAIDPRNPITLAITGWVLVRLERFEEALANLNTARENAPDYAETYHVLGDLYSLHLYGHDKAIEAYGRFYALNPDTVSNLLYIGTAYDDLGMSEEAVRYFERYLGAVPEGSEADVARIRTYLIRGEDQQLEALLQDMGERYGGNVRWVDVMLSTFDLARGQPERVIDRVEQHYPEFLLGGAEIASIPEQFDLALVYATALHLTGEAERAMPLTARILELIPTKSRHRWDGVMTKDTWLHVAMGDEERALQSVRDWRAMGGLVDLTKHRMVPASLFDHPDFQAINNEVLGELAKQRANLARMQAAGELAPLPEFRASR